MTWILLRREEFNQMDWPIITHEEAQAIYYITRNNLFFRR